MEYIDEVAVHGARIKVYAWGESVSYIFQLGKLEIVAKTAGFQNLPNWIIEAMRDAALANVNYQDFEYLPGFDYDDTDPVQNQLDDMESNRENPYL